MVTPTGTYKKAGKQSAAVAKETQNKILAAALDCFATKGFNSTTLRDIADAADTTHGLVRHHFGSKDLLWRECVSSALARAQRLQLPVLKNVTDDNVLESFKKVVRELIRHSAENPEMWRLIMFEALKDSDRLTHLLEIILPLHKSIDPLFNRVQAQGYFKNYSNDDFFLLLVSLGAIPFATSAFSSKVFGKNILSKNNRKKHEDMVINLLFGESGSIN